MHDAIAALAAHLGAIEPGLSTAFDYRIDIHRADGSATYPLIYRADSPGPTPGMPFSAMVIPRCARSELRSAAHRPAPAGFGPL